MAYGKVVRNMGDYFVKDTAGHERYITNPEKAEKLLGKQAEFELVSAGNVKLTGKFMQPARDGFAAPKREAQLRRGWA